MLGLNPPMLQCSSAVISDRSCGSFLLSVPKVLRLILFKDCAEGLGWYAGAALHLSRSLLSSLLLLLLMKRKVAHVAVKSGTATPETARWVNESQTKQGAAGPTSVLDPG